jgi:hypothetical protein
MMSIPHRASGWVSKPLSGFDGHRISESSSGNRAARSISQVDIGRPPAMAVAAFAFSWGTALSIESLQ